MTQTETQTLQTLLHKKGDMVNEAVDYIRKGNLRSARMLFSIESSINNEIIELLVKNIEPDEPITKPDIESDTELELEETTSEDANTETEKETTL